MDDLNNVFAILHLRKNLSQSVMRIEQKRLIENGTRIVGKEGNNDNIRLNEILEEVGAVGNLRSVAFLGKGNLHKKRRIIDIGIRHPDTQIDIITPPATRTHQCITLSGKMLV